LIHSKCSPDKHAYLVDNNNSRTGKVFKRSGILLTVVALGAWAIWTYTPISTEANYKPEKAGGPIQITASANFPALSTQTDLPQAAIHQATAKDQLFPSIEFAAIKLPALANPVAEHVDQPDAPTNPVLPAEIEGHPGLVLKTPDDNVSPIEQPDVTSAIVEAVANELSAEDARRHAPKGRVETFTIVSGDSLTRIFQRANLPISRAIELSKTADAKQLNRLSIGKTMRIYFDANDQWETLEYDTSKFNTLIVSPVDAGFEVSQHEKQVSYQSYSARGTIESSLGIAAESVDISNTITQKLVDIYKWEVDFARDLQAGDTFSVVYQKAYIDDEFIADGEILAASFTTGGRTIEAIRYTDSQSITGYFQPDGQSLRRGFLRTPVKLARITSRFGKRKHPIKKVWKKHLGVDYGARSGTPVLSTADGVVQYSGKKGGYGNTVILRHGGIYTTLYAHMKKMGKGIRSGKAVTQGQVIGYVGQTGWATGDHLHYEFRVNGQHKNPLNVKLPKINPLAKKEMDAFTDHALPLLGTLTSLKVDQLAINSLKSSDPTL
jgi:murein DD-endopeptidase MepM/ murein hydrolase activator NlpD